MQIAISAIQVPLLGSRARSIYASIANESEKCGARKNGYHQSMQCSDIAFTSVVACANRIHTITIRFYLHFAEPIATPRNVRIRYPTEFIGIGIINSAPIFLQLTID